MEKFHKTSGLFHLRVNEILMANLFLFSTIIRKRILRWFYYRFPRGETEGGDELFFEVKAGKVEEHYRHLYCSMTWNWNWTDNFYDDVRRDSWSWLENDSCWRWREREWQQPFGVENHIRSGEKIELFFQSWAAIVSRAVLRCKKVKERCWDNEY